MELVRGVPITMFCNERRLTTPEGVVPSYDEIREALGLASKSGVFRLVDALEARGQIRRMRHYARSIQIVGSNSRLEAQAFADRLIKAAKEGGHVMDDGDPPPLFIFTERELRALLLKAYR